MAETVQIEVWVMVDDAGDYAVARESDGLADAYEADVQSCSDAQGLRRVKVTLTIPLPTVAELEGTVEDLDEPGQLTTS